MTYLTCAMLYRDVPSSRSHEPFRETTRVVSRLCMLGLIPRMMALIA